MAGTLVLDFACRVDGDLGVPVILNGIGLKLLLAAGEFKGDRVPSGLVV